MKHRLQNEVDFISEFPPTFIAGEKKLNYILMRVILSIILSFQKAQSVRLPPAIATKRSRNIVESKKKNRFLFKARGRFAQ